MEALASARVAVFGVGGVGGYVCEALCRSGVGAFDLIDNDRVCLSNLNRQIIATQQTLGQLKVEAMRERILQINPQAKVRAHACFFLPENADAFPFDAYSYVVDAVDTVAAKLALVMACKRCGTPIISSMGAGNKLDPTALRVADIFETHTDPLARVMRRELKRRGVDRLKVVCSEEQPLRPLRELEADDPASFADTPHAHPRRSTPGSTAFVPSVAGLIIAAQVVKDLTAPFMRR